MCAQLPGGQNGSHDQDGCHHTVWLPARTVSFIDFVTGYFCLHISKENTRVDTDRRNLLGILKEFIVSSEVNYLGKFLMI